MFSTLRVTCRCNLKCLHCYSAEVSCGNELRTCEVKSAIDILARNGVDHITISGGEPFLRSDIFDILKYSSKRAKTGIVCNGTLLDKSAARRLSGIDISHIMVSVDGTGDAHDKLRGKNAYSKTVKGVMNCLDYGLPLGVSTTLSRLNSNHIMDIYDFLKENNIRRWIIEKLKPVGRAKEANIHIEKKDEDVLMDILRQLKAGDADMNISVYDCAANCSSGIKTISVSPNGDVTPCAFMPDAICGNILHDPWNDIAAKIREFQTGGVTCFQRC